jgi:hypothetical protein
MEGGREPTEEERGNLRPREPKESTEEERTGEQGKTRRKEERKQNKGDREQISRLYHV